MNAISNRSNWEGVNKSCDETYHPGVAAIRRALQFSNVSNELIFSATERRKKGGIIRYPGSISGYKPQCGRSKDEHRL